MAQKVLAARSGDEPETPAQAGELVSLEVDQIVLARAPMRAFGQALAAGLKKAPAEVAVSYDGQCVGGADPEAASASAAAGEMLAHGLLVARAGVGFPVAVHLERFASPARLCITDEPRLAGVGGIGMLPLVVPTASLAQALGQATVLVRVPVSVQVLLSGRLRPFVCARDVALELLRRGLGEVVRRVEEARGAPVVVEFAGPSVRSLSVSERGVLAAVAPQLGAAAALFVSDERTEVFLRDQRRSKAHRVLVADAGAPYEEVVNVDLGAVDPLVLDEQGQVRAVRDLAGQPVTQVLLGGDCGATLRDLFAAATLLKSKRVPSRLDFLLAVPSRQMLEVLASAGALTDLIATGARLVEPDARVVTGDLYGPPRSGVALQTCDPEPRRAGARAPLVVSAETLAFAVATGEVGDPRSFKRPVRITVPRALPTDDVLVARKLDRASARTSGARRGERPEPARALARAEGLGAFPAWKAAQTLELMDRTTFAQSQTKANAHADANADRQVGVAVLCVTLDEVRDLAGRSAEIAHVLRAVLAPYIPSSLVSLLSAAGIAAIRLDATAAKALRGQKSLALPAPSQWSERHATNVAVGTAKLPLTWLAQGPERAWVTGTASPAGASPLASPSGARAARSHNTTPVVRAALTSGAQ